MKAYNQTKRIEWKQQKHAIQIFRAENDVSVVRNAFVGSKQNILLGHQKRRSSSSRIAKRSEKLYFGRALNFNRVKVFYVDKLSFGKALN